MCIRDSVSLYCGALAVVITLAHDRYLVSLFIWGSGSLSVIGWTPLHDLLIKLLLTSIPLIWLLRPLEVIEIGDSSTQAVGINVTAIRLFAICVASAIAAFVTASVGVIGFVGLCAPLIARLSGARRFRTRLLWSAVIGCLLYTSPSPRDATLSRMPSSA